MLAESNHDRANSPLTVSSDLGNDTQHLQRSQTTINITNTSIKSPTTSSSKQVTHTNSVKRVATSVPKYIKQYATVPIRTAVDWTVGMY